MKKALICLLAIGLAACSSDSTPCDGVQCSGHGSCAITPHHTPQCLCEEGYRNEGPTECVPDEGAECNSDAECDDSNLCTDDVCDPAEGCQYTDNTDPCDDGDICSILDTCSNGVCVAGATDLDADSDGYYDAACPDGDDCNDGDAAINPGAAENCTDSIDNDCDTLTDDDDPVCQGPTGVYYVRTDGDDTNTGEENTPQGAWRNIQKAADTLVAGETVLVQAGTYHEEVYPYNDGDSGNPITYKSDGAVILDGENSRAFAFYLDSDSYIVIDGFEITNYYDSGGDDGTIFMGNGSTHNLVTNCIIHDTGRDCIYLTWGADNNQIENCLLYDCYDDGITPNSDSSAIRSCTIYGTGEWGIEQGTGNNTIFENNIIWDSVNGTSGYTWNYNNLRDSVPSGNGNMSEDPLFVDTNNRDFHLSHTAAGQGADSPCIDAGGDTAANLQLDDRTTRSDGVVDSGTVDLGFHYLP